jgi:hypothetical protein
LVTIIEKFEAEIDKDEAWDELEKIANQREN